MANPNKAHHQGRSHPLLHGNRSAGYGAEGGAGGPADGPGPEDFVIAVSEIAANAVRYGVAGARRLLRVAGTVRRRPRSATAGAGGRVRGAGTMDGGRIGA
jgi:hypothetical protein